MNLRSGTRRGEERESHGSATGDRATGRSWRGTSQRSWRLDEPRLTIGCEKRPQQTRLDVQSTVARKAERDFGRGEAGVLR
jgi:hypothetical protein